MENAVMPTAVDLRRWAAGYPELQDRAAILTAQLALARQHPNVPELREIAAGSVRLLTQETAPARLAISTRRSSRDG